MLGLQPKTQGLDMYIRKQRELARDGMEGRED